MLDDVRLGGNEPCLNFVQRVFVVDSLTWRSPPLSNSSLASAILWRVVRSPLAFNMPTARAYGREVVMELI